MGVERWFSHWEQVILPQRTQICFPAPIPRDLQLLLNSSRWTRHLWPLSKHRHKHRCTCTQIHAIKNKISLFYLKKRIFLDIAERLLCLIRRSGTWLRIGQWIQCSDIRDDLWSSLWWSSLSTSYLIGLTVVLLVAWVHCFTGVLVSCCSCSNYQIVPEMSLAELVRGSLDDSWRCLGLPAFPLCRAIN